MKHLWRLGGLSAILAVGAVVGGVLLGAAINVGSIDAAISPDLFLQAIAGQFILWRVYVLLTLILAPALLIVANGALFDYMAYRGSSSARAGLWLGTAGLSLLLFVGAAQYVIYPRLAAAFLENPDIALDVFRPLRLVDEALRLLSPLIGLGVPALLVGVLGWRGRMLPRLALPLALLVFAGHVAALIMDYQISLLNNAVFGLTLFWIAISGLVLLTRTESRERSKPRGVAAQNRQPKRPSSRSAAQPSPSSPAPEAPSPETSDPYTPLPDDIFNEADDHTRWRPPAEHEHEKNMPIDVDSH